MLCHIIKRLSSTDTSRNLHWYVNENFESIGIKITDSESRDRLCQNQPVGTIWFRQQGLGKNLAYSRIDLYGTTGYGFGGAHNHMAEEDIQLRLTNGWGHYGAELKVQEINPMFG